MPPAVFSRGFAEDIETLRLADLRRQLLRIPSLEHNLPS
jgi:hypothetical protein